MENDSAVETENSMEKESNTIAVYSRNIAQSLVIDFNYFFNLIAIKKNPKYPNRRIWIFYKSGNLENDFNKLVDDARKLRAEREKEKKEIDQAVGSDCND